MKKILAVSVLLCLLGCTDKKTESAYPVINLVNSVKNYQRVYCSDLFSSIEVIPLETTDENIFRLTSIKSKDNIIFISGGDFIYTFDSSGNFLNTIGQKGQGPEEYNFLGNVFFNTDKPTLFVEDFKRILEYDFNGNFINAFSRPKTEEGYMLGNCSYVGNGLFIGSISYNGKNENKSCLFNNNGEIIESFPNHFFYEVDGLGGTSWGALSPIRVDDKLYFKDECANDTIYVLDNLNLKPAYVFELGDYTVPIKYFQTFDPSDLVPTNAFVFKKVIGTPKYFFYEMRCIPQSLPYPKMSNNNINNVLGIYDVKEGTNIFLDTDDNLRTGIVNDMNGGLPFIPAFYAGNGTLIGVWNPDEMIETLTDEYFNSQTIKDHEGHQKLKGLLKELKEDDNTVVVIATLKD
ncbi:hypothetical protein M2138_000684 [Dysgonomonadaceae bacterium PH5-43]|nr:hypothetical protein [Dysgonomonadaceae bacterium PH5-43]